MSSMAYVTFLIVTAIVMCGVVESAPRPKETAINEVAKNQGIANENNEALRETEGSSVKDEVNVQETRTVVCPPGYEPVEDYCYNINLQLGDFQQHKDLCFQTGGYLIDISTKDESDALIKYLRSWKLDTPHYDQHFLHIGLADLKWGTQSSQLFSWLNTWDIPYENWAPGYPNDYGCGVVSIQEKDFGKWWGHSCQRLKGGICEANPLAKFSHANR